MRAFSAALSKNYYGILGVESHATDSQIKDAYRSLAKKYHPDVRSSLGAEKSSAEHDPDVEKFRDVVEAY